MDDFFADLLPMKPKQPAASSSDVLCETRNSNFDQDTVLVGELSASVPASRVEAADFLSQGSENKPMGKGKSEISSPKPLNKQSVGVEAVVEGTVRRFANGLQRVLEEITRKLDALEGQMERLERAVSDAREVDSLREDAFKDRFFAVDKGLRDVNRGVQLIRDKQELLEAQAELSKLAVHQNGQSDTSKETAKKSEDGPQAPRPTPAVPSKEVALSNVAAAAPAVPAPNQAPTDDKPSPAAISAPEPAAPAAPTMPVIHPTHQPALHQPSQPASQQPVLQQLVSQQPVLQQPALQQPVVQQPVSQQPPQAQLHAPVVPQHQVFAAQPQQPQQQVLQPQPQLQIAFDQSLLPHQMQPQLPGTQESYQGQRQYTPSQQPPSATGTQQTPFNPSLPQPAQQSHQSAQYSSAMQPSQQAPPYSVPAPPKPYPAPSQGYGSSYPGSGSQQYVAQAPSSQRPSPATYTSQSHLGYPTMPNAPPPPRARSSHSHSGQYGGQPFSAPPQYESGYSKHSSSGARQPSSHQAAQTGSRSVPLEQIIDDVATMGFSRQDVRAVVGELMDKGQAVDLNVVLDRLMNGPR